MMNTSEAIGDPISKYAEAAKQGHTANQYPLTQGTANGWSYPYYYPYYPGVCPSCGRCPVCGDRGHYRFPQVTYTCNAQSNQ